MQNKPHGQGLSGFIFGLLLATLIIGVVLYFLNNTPSGIKQPEAPKTEIQPEILTPRQERQPEQRPSDTTVGSDSGRYALPPGDITDKPPVAASVPQQASTPAQRPEDKPEQDKPAQTKPREQQRKPEPEAKPTPEQILESGNVERAREQARRQRREAEAKAAREAEAKTAEQRAQRNAEAHSGGNGRYIVQMGSYNNPQAADTQRAKLAMLGVNARVTSSKRSDGQTVYRIQSGRLSRAEAQALSERLRGNGIDTLTRQTD
ncbi:SPOR domain-containing protein [Eikenella halliae]|uniref:SPOR domain-containing protein n=1 Tax=Eikenella halliae TaxID=1795832 RepID=UPI0028D61362|nr:SPOR domain-containing protein [Eikenella halliae]